MRPFVIYSFYSGGLWATSIGEHNCGLAGGILLFKLVVFLWLGLLVKLVRNVCGLLQKLYTKKLVKKKKTRIIVQKVFGR
ncbi:hypothetical protein Peur_020887 [Populus x canadensis]